MKFLAIFVSVSSTFGGIPWAFARNWVCPLTIACTISLQPVRIGFDFPHAFSLLWILSTIGSHSVLMFMLFLLRW